MFEQERVIGRLQRTVQADPAVFACFLAGSYGRRSEDNYSDIDVALIFADDSDRDTAWIRRSALARSIMPYVSLKAFDAVHIRPYLHICLLANGSKLDFRYESAASIIPGPWDGRLRILKDSDGWAERYQVNASTTSWSRPVMSQTELQSLDERFWVMYWDILRLLARGETDKPFPIYLELLSFTLPPLLRALPEDDASRRKLMAAYYSLDPQATIVQLQNLFEAYLDARAAIIRHYHLPPVGDSAFESEISRHIQRLGS